MEKIRIDKESKRAFILDREVTLLDQIKSYYELECNIEDTKGLVCADIFERLEFYFKDSAGIDIPFLDRVWIIRDEGQSDILLTAFITCPDYSWHRDIAMHAVLRELASSLLEGDSQLSYETGSEENTFWMSVYLPLDGEDLYLNIYNFLCDVRIKLRSVEQKITGFQWKEEYYTDEVYFTKDLLVPLFRKMGFNHVRYNHGPREFGKDLLLSETNKLFNTRNIAVQIKAGNVSGKAHTLIDIIISQIRDSFEVPVQGPGASKQFRISEVYFVISGKYTENAKDKINAKLPPEFSASTFFLDKEDVEWLTHKHWPFK